MIIITNNVCKQCYADMDVFVLVAALYHSLQEYCLEEAKTSHGVTLRIFPLERWEFFALI